MKARNFSLMFTLCAFLVPLSLTLMEGGIGLFIKAKRALFPMKMSSHFALQSLATVPAQDTGKTYSNRFFSFRFGPQSSYGKPSLAVQPLPEEFKSKYQIDDLLLRTDKWGFIKTNHEGNPFSHDPTKLKVVCFGGSTMAGWGAAPKESIPSHIHNVLREKGTDSTIINAGVVSYNSVQEFLYYTLEIVHLKPDLVVFLDGFNDQYGEGRSYSPSLEPMASPNQPALFTALNLASTVFPNLMQALRKVVPVKPQPEPAFFTEMKNNYKMTFEHILQNTVATSIGHGIPIVLALQPELNSKAASDRTPYEIEVAHELNLTGERSRYDAALKAYDSVRAKHAGNKQVTVLNLLDLFNGVKETTYFDVVHYTDRGNQVLAAALSKPILGLVKEKKDKKTLLLRRG